MQKKRVKRVICLLASVAMLMSLLTGCGEKETAQTEGGGSEPVAEKEAAAEGPVRLVYMTSWEDKTEYNEYVAEVGKKFAEENPDICSGVDILPVSYSGYEAKFQTALASGTYVCDIFQGQPQTYHAFADPMPEEFADWVDENVVDYLKAIGTYDGVRYGIPQEAGNFQQLYINVDMFEEAGLDPNVPPKTFAELKEMAAKLTQYNDDGSIKVAGFGIRYSGEGQGIADKNLSTIHSFGGKMFDPETDTASGLANSPETIEGVKWIKSLLDDNITNTEIGVPETAFGQGTAAMILRESWVVGHLENNAPEINFKVYPIPVVEGQEAVGAGNLFPWAHMVYKDSPNKEVAWKFLEYLYADAENDLNMNIAAGYLPVLKGNYDTEYVKSRKDYDSVMAVLDRGYTPCSDYYVEEMSELSAIFGNAILEVLYDESTPEDAMNYAAEQMDIVLQEE